MGMPCVRMHSGMKNARIAGDNFPWTSFSLLLKLFSSLQLPLHLNYWRKVLHKYNSFCEMSDVDSFFYSGGLSVLFVCFQDTIKDI